MRCLWGLLSRWVLDSGYDETWIYRFYYLNLNFMASGACRLVS